MVIVTTGCRLTLLLNGHHYYLMLLVIVPVRETQSHGTPQHRAGDTNAYASYYIHQPLTIWKQFKVLSLEVPIIRLFGFL